jgi:hypothetical protein
MTHTTKTWTKVLAGCGGLGCLATVSLVVLMIQVGSSLPEPSPEQRAQWEAERRQRQEEQREREEQERREEQEQQRRQEQLEREALYASRMLRDGEGRFRSLVRHVFDVHYGYWNHSLGEGDYFPLYSPDEWEAVQVFEPVPAISPCVVYRYRSEDFDVRFAVLLPITVPPPPAGSAPSRGCYLYGGSHKREGSIPNCTPFMTFQWMPASDDVPICAG